MFRGVKVISLVGLVVLCRKEARKNRLKEAAVAIKTTGKDQQVRF
jgi:hypothetical protein